MGVYIPNMDKPKSCEKCRFRTCFIKVNLKKYTCWLNGEECGKTDCPLIDIVTCGECKHRDPEDKKCDCGMFERQGCIFSVADDYFCKYGERRAD